MKFSVLRKYYTIMMVMSILMISGCTKTNQQPIDMTLTPTKQLDNRSPYPTETELFIQIPTLLMKTDMSVSEDILRKWTIVDHHPFANQIQVMLLDTAGNLWTGGSSGVTEWDVENHTATIHTLYPESKKTHVVSIAQTPNKDLWVGTFGNGLSRYDGKEWRIYTKEDGLPSNYINSIIATSEGKLWIDPSPHDPDLGALEGAKFGIFDGQRWTQGIGGGFFKMVGAPDGTLWALQWGPDQVTLPSIARFDGKKWNTVMTGYELDHLVTSAITVAPDQKIWAAARDGIYIYDGRTWEKLIPPWIGETAADVSTIAVTQDGTAWFGFSYGVGFLGYGACGDRLPTIEEWGVYHWDGSTWQHYTDQDGLVDNKICDIKVGNDGSVWFGSFDRGISRLQGDQWTSFVIP